jgi:hypothetical protein
VTGIVAARRVYESLSIQPPLCLELHTKMATLESIQPNMNPKHVRRCYEMACNQFGKSNTGKLQFKCSSLICLSYAQFEMKYELHIVL